MANQQSESNLINTVIRLIEANIAAGGNLDNLIPIMALLCILSIFSRPGHTNQSVANSSSANPLQKILSEVVKGDSGPSPETLMSLLPLLNNPQVKSKLNPATLTAILGLLNNMGMGHSDSTDNSKIDKSPPEAPAAAMTYSSTDAGRFAVLDTNHDTVGKKNTTI